MANPFRSLADLIEQLIATRKPTDDVAKALAGFGAQLDRIEAAQKIDSAILSTLKTDIVTAIAQLLGVPEPEPLATNLSISLGQPETKS